MQKLCSYLSTGGFEYHSLRQKSKKKATPTIVPCVGLPVGHWALGSEQAVGWVQQLDQLTAVTPLLRNKLARHPTGFQPPAKRGLSLKKTCFQYFAPNISELFFGSQICFGCCYTFFYFLLLLWSGGDSTADEFFAHVSSPIKDVEPASKRYFQKSS